MHEQLRGHRSQRPPFEACLGPSRPSLRRDRESLQACEGEQGSLGELRNMINVGYLITPHGNRTQGEPGLHYTDYPVHAYDKK